MPSHKWKPPTFDSDTWHALEYLPKEPEYTFLIAVYENNVRRLRELVAEGDPHINYCDLSFGCALEFAVRCDDLTAVDILLEAGADPWASWASSSSHSYLETSDSPIMAAVELGNSFLFHRLCKYGRPGDGVHSRRIYRAFLLRAVSAGQANIVEDILSRSEETMPRSQEPIYVATLQTAAKERYVHVVRLLLGQFKYSTFDLDAALQTAAAATPGSMDEPERGVIPSLDCLHQQEVIGLLIDAGADPNRCIEIVNNTARYIDRVGALKVLWSAEPIPTSATAAREQRLCIVSAALSVLINFTIIAMSQHATSTRRAYVFCWTTAPAF